VVSQDVLFTIFDEFIGLHNPSLILHVTDVYENGDVQIDSPEGMGGSFSPWNKYPMRFYCHPVPYYMNDGRRL
jgi:hypothetical protein